MTHTLTDVTDALLSAAKRAGADASDAIAITDIAISADVRGGALEQAERAESTDIGLRVFVGQRQACVSSSDTKPDTLRQMAERAVAMAKEAPEDPHAGLADANQLATDIDTARLDLFDPSEEPDPAALQDDAMRAEAAALRNKEVSQVQSASAGYGRRRIHLAASNGFSAGYSRSDRGLSCVAISGTGESVTMILASGRCFRIRS